MILRALQPDDYERVKQIHEKFYRDEFSFPDFLTNFLLGFIIEENNEIVVIGGVKTLAEVILITNKDVSVRVRRKSLLEALKVSMLTSKMDNYNQIHAFVQDPIWQKHLEKAGFRPTKGKGFYLDI